MADTFVQLMAFSATINYKDNKVQAALAAELCSRVAALVAETRYDALNIIGWTLEENMLKWVKFHNGPPEPSA